MSVLPNAACTGHTADQQPHWATPPAKGFFGALFDFSFDSFVTPSIVKVVYVLATVALAVGFVVFLFAAIFTGEPAAVIFTLVLGPVLVLSRFVCDRPV